MSHSVENSRHEKHLGHEEHRRDVEHLEEERLRRRKMITRLWLWIGVIVLCALLLIWIFAIGTFEGPDQ